MLFGRYRLLALLVGLPLASGLGAPAGHIEFNRDVRPILSRNCFRCHGPDDKTIQEIHLHVSKSVMGQSPADADRDHGKKRRALCDMLGHACQYDHGRNHHGPAANTHHTR